MQCKQCWLLKKSNSIRLFIPLMQTSSKRIFLVEQGQAERPMDQWPITTLAIVPHPQLHYLLIVGSSLLSDGNPHMVALSQSVLFWIVRPLPALSQIGAAAVISAQTLPPPTSVSCYCWQRFSSWRAPFKCLVLKRSEDPRCLRARLRLPSATSLPSTCNGLSQDYDCPIIPCVNRAV